MRAHRKLSDYYNKINDSPYYIWSSHLSFLYLIDMGFAHLFDMMPVLDPRISYQGLLADCEDDILLQSHLDQSQDCLHTFYREHYTNTNTVSSTPSTSAPQPPGATGSPQKLDFMARYNKRAQAFVDELEEYFKLAQESFEHCDPIHWWAGHCAQFPNLSCLARDILSIPGKLVIIVHAY